jgi:uncharacterized protein
MRRRPISGDPRTPRMMTPVPCSRPSPASGGNSRLRAADAREPGSAAPADFAGTGECGIPTDDEILGLHEKHAPTADALDLVHEHCLIVCGIAEQLYSRSAAGREVDIDLVRAGALLHDIGVYRLYDDAGNLDGRNYIRHGILGYELLQEEGIPEAVCRFASHHTGVGISRDDVLAQELPLPPADYLAETAEERLVMYADKFHSKKTPPVFLTAPAYAASVRRYGEDKVTAFQAMRAAFGEPDLAPFSDAYRQDIIGAG